MNFLGTILLFGGYVLVYAATAKGGRFATEPWNGIMTDAYVSGALTPAQIAAAQTSPLVPKAPFSRPRSVGSGLGTLGTGVGANSTVITP